MGLQFFLQLLTSIYELKTQGLQFLLQLLTSIYELKAHGASLFTTVVDKHL